MIFLRRWTKLLMKIFKVLSSSFRLLVVSWKLIFAYHIKLPAADTLCINFLISLYSGLSHSAEETGKNKTPLDGHFVSHWKGFVAARRGECDIVVSSLARLHCNHGFAIYKCSFCFLCRWVSAIWISRHRSSTCLLALHWSREQESKRPRWCSLELKSLPFLQWIKIWKFHFGFAV